MLASDQASFDSESLLGRIASDDFCDPQVEWDASEVPMPDLAGVYHGIAGVREFWREWLAAWCDLRFDYELAAAGDRAVILVGGERRARRGGAGSAFTQRRAGRCIAAFIATQLAWIGSIHGGG